MPLNPTLKKAFVGAGDLLGKASRGALAGRNPNAVVALDRPRLQQERIEADRELQDNRFEAKPGGTKR